MPREIGIAVFVLCMFELVTQVSGFTINTEFGANYEAYCPKRQFVSHIEIYKGKNITRYNESDIRFFLQCDIFADYRVSVCLLNDTEWKRF